MKKFSLNIHGLGKNFYIHGNNLKLYCTHPFVWELGEGIYQCVHRDPGNVRLHST